MLKDIYIPGPLNVPLFLINTTLWQDNEKKNILAVQTIRNTIMGSTLMATTSILLCSGLAAVISSTYSVKKPLNDAIYGAHGEFMVALKYVTLLVIFLFSFMCHSLSIRFISQVNYLINCPQDLEIVTSMYVSELLEKSFSLNAIGNRLFYLALPIVLWIFGPLLVFLCSLTMVPVLYNLDIVFGEPKKGRTCEVANEVWSMVDEIVTFFDYMICCTLCLWIMIYPKKKCLWIMMILNVHLILWDKMDIYD